MPTQIFPGDLSAERGRLIMQAALSLGQGIGNYKRATLENQIVSSQLELEKLKVSQARMEEAGSNIPLKIPGGPSLTPKQQGELDKLPPSAKNYYLQKQMEFLQGIQGLKLGERSMEVDAARIMALTREKGDALSFMKSGVGTTGKVPGPGESPLGEGIVSGPGFVAAKEAQEARGGPSLTTMFHGVEQAKTPSAPSIPTKEDITSQLSSSVLPTKYLEMIREIDSLGKEHEKGQGTRIIKAMRKRDAGEVQKIMRDRWNTLSDVQKESFVRLGLKHGFITVAPGRKPGKTASEMSARDFNELNVGYKGTPASALSLDIKEYAKAKGLLDIQPAHMLWLAPPRKKAFNALWKKLEGIFDKKQQFAVIEAFLDQYGGELTTEDIEEITKFGLKHKLVGK